MSATIRVRCAIPKADMNPTAYANAFALTAGEAVDAVLLTGDTEFESVKGLVQVQRIRG